MTRTEKYILNEVKVIEKECLENGVSPSEWVEKHARSYRRKWNHEKPQETKSLKFEVNRSSPLKKRS